MSPPEPERAVYEAAVRALFSRRPEVMKPGLERIRDVSARLGDPQRAYPSVHITGTNGKTTVAGIVSGVLDAHGVRTGTYTSPHLQDVRERIRVAGRPLSRRDIVVGLDELAPVLAAVEARRGEMVTFFETLTALATAHFATAGVEAGVLEVGMGGRWDATNLCDGRVAVVNRVALDHAELGSTVEAVAGEKAGIVKDGAVVVSAGQQPSVDRLLARATAERGGRLLRAGADFRVRARRPAPGGQHLVVDTPRGRSLGVFLPLHGAHQAENAAVALAAAEAMLTARGGELSPVRARRALATVRSPGRLEVFPRPGLAPVVLDGAHNPAGAESLATALRSEFGYRRRVLVLGVLGDKDVEGIVDALLGIADEIVATQPVYSRAAPAERLAKVARMAGRVARVAEDVPGALEAASHLAGPEDVIVVTGSLYTVGEARDALGGALA